MDLVGTWQQTQGRVVDIARDLGEEEAARTVPACPQWTVKDLVAHMVGVGADALDQTTDESLSEQWTQQHVEQREAADLSTVVEEWSGLAPRIAELIGQADEEAAANLVVDVSTHEQDLRGAVGRPGARDSEAMQLGATAFAGMFGDKVRAAGLAPVTLESDGPDGWSYLAGGPQDGQPGWEGGTNAAIGVRAPLFELHRGLSGRRSQAQVRGWEWTDDPGPYLPLLSAFGSLRDDDLVE